MVMIHAQLLRTFDFFKKIGKLAKYGEDELLEDTALGHGFNLLVLCHHRFNLLQLLHVGSRVYLSIMFRDQSSIKK